MLDETAAWFTCPVTDQELPIVGGLLGNRPATGRSVVLATEQPPPAPPPAPAPLPPEPPAPAAPRSRRTLWIILGAVALVAAVVVAVIVLGSDDETTPQTPEGLVIERLDASAADAQTACDAVHTFAADRVTLTQLLDTMPAAAQQSLVTSLKSQGSDLLPPESNDWGFPEIRRGLITLWDQCQKRGLGG